MIYAFCLGLLLGALLQDMEVKYINKINDSLKLTINNLQDENDKLKYLCDIYEDSNKSKQNKELVLDCNNQN